MLYLFSKMELFDTEMSNTGFYSDTAFIIYQKLCDNWIKEKKLCSGYEELEGTRPQTAREAFLFLDNCVTILIHLLVWHNSSPPFQYICVHHQELN